MKKITPATFFKQLFKKPTTTTTTTAATTTTANKPTTTTTNNNKNENENEKDHQDASNNAVLENLVDEIFNQPPLSNPSEEIFITLDNIEESVQKKPYEDFIPTISFQFSKSLKDIDYDNLQNFLSDDLIILNVERYPTILQIATLSNKDFETTFTKLKQKFNSTTGQSIIGNLVCEPEIHIPSEEDIKNVFNRPSLNHLINSIDFDKKQIKKIQQIVIEKLKKDKNMYNWKFLFTYDDIYDKMEKQIRDDLKINSFEMIMIDQTIFKNKLIIEYETIKKRIPEKDIVECFFYYQKQNNEGIYATDNPFYASIYSNGKKILKINEKTKIFCCRAIFNKTKINELNENQNYEDVKNNYGCNHQLVGDSTGFLPINPLEKDKNSITANEYIFLNKSQIIPLCSFTVMRKDHYILWKDENINNDANTKFLKELSKNNEVNIYAKNNVEDALKVIHSKKFIPFKLITNGGGPNLTGKQLIERARSITHSKFVCLVFAASPSHLDWVTKMENVLFTSDENDARKFAGLKMNMNDVLAFALQLSNKYEAYKYKFKINKEELLKFPQNENQQQECNLA